MGFKEIFSESTIAKYVRAMKAAPREVILSKKLLLSAALYAMAGIPISTFFTSKVFLKTITD